MIPFVTEPAATSGARQVLLPLARRVAPPKPGPLMVGLAKIGRRCAAVLRPAPAEATVEPDRLLAAHIGQQRLREAQILETLELEGPCSIRRLVDRLYGHVDKRLHPAAADIVLAHLIKLAREGQVDCCEGLPTLRAIYRVRRWRDAA